MIPLRKNTLSILVEGKDSHRAIMLYEGETRGGN